MPTKRQEQIFKIIVEDYIKNPYPVSSKSICDILNCSSATVRAEMSELERLGLIEKTHTSSGRVPSEAGYRYYVDNIMVPKEMSGEEVLKLQRIVDNKSLMISDVITRSMEIISELTNYTTIVLGKSSLTNRVNKIEVIPIDEQNLVAIIVTDKGYVEHKNIYIDSAVDMEEIKKTVEIINKLIVGTLVKDVTNVLEYEVKPVIQNYITQHEVLYNAFYNAFSDFTNNERVNVSGTKNMLMQPEFSDTNKIREILNKFDDKSLIRSIDEKENGVNVYIGHENNFDDDVTVIKTKYKLNGEEGTIALIGPKRMEYDRVIALLNYITNNIEK